MRLARQIAVLALLLAAPATVAAQNNKRETFREKMRELWDDHVVWTRLFIVSAAAGLSDRDATTNRLLQNQTDIGNAIEPFYGKDAGDRLTALLRDHIVIAAALVDSAKAGKNVAADSINRRWHANAEEIVMFLHTANPKQWPVETLRLMMATHLQQTYNEAKHRLKGEYAADVKDFDGIQAHILKMADLLAEGVIQQFPQKFYGTVAKR